MIRVNILAFGVAKEILSGSSIMMEMNDECSVRDLKQSLEEKFPKLKQLSSFMIAVNSQYATGDQVVHEKDEIAVIPPVSGG